MDRTDKKLPRGVFETSPGSNKFGIRITDAYGNRPERVIGTRDQAIKAAKQARDERRRSRVLAPKRPKPTFRQIADLGVAYAMLNNADPRKMESMLNHFCEGICDQTTGMTYGDRIAEEISTTEFKAWLNSKAEAREWSDSEWANVTKRKYRSAIRICYREAKRLDLLAVDPTEKIKFKREDYAEVRAITPEELDRIRTAIKIPGNKHRTAAFCRECLAQFETARQTGMRKSEQFRATWENISWERRVLFIPKSKSTYPRDVYLNSYVLAILRSLQAEQTREGVLPSGRIFNINNPRSWFMRTLEYAKITGVTWKSLRHQFATDLVAAKVHIKYVQELMGHLAWQSTARYIHPDDESAFEAVDTLTDDKVPEYLLNREYLWAILDDDADMPAPPMPQPPVSHEELGLATSPETQVRKSDLPPRLLSSFPRQELYDLVWSQPMIRIAGLLGRSDVAVAKACRRRNIPLPTQGYWNKLAAGKPVPPRPPLPPI